MAPVGREPMVGFGASGVPKPTFAPGDCRPISEIQKVRSLADGTGESIPVADQLLIDHGLAAREALVAGRGIAAAHVWLIDDLLAAGVVEQVLPDLLPDPVPLSMLLVPGRTRIKRIRSFVGALATAMAAVPGLSRA